jgi:YidC/Oxa1 family membrane protein insertase
MNPLKYIVGLSTDAIQRLGDIASSVTGKTYDVVRNIDLLGDIQSLPYSHFSNVEGFTAEMYEKLPNLKMFGGAIDLGAIPSFENFNWLLLVPVLTFVVYFGSMKLSKKFMYQPTQAENQPGAGCSNNIMDVSMPLMSVFFTFAVPAVIGVYWMFKSVLSTIQQFIVAKIMPIPTFTEEDYKAAEKELGVKNKKNTEKKERDPGAPRPRSLHHIDDEDYNEKGELKPAPKAPEVKASETPVGAAPLKNDEPEHKSKKDKKSEKDAPEADKAEENNEENK